MPCTEIAAPPGLLDGMKLRHDKMLDPERHHRRPYRYTMSNSKSLDTEEPKMYEMYCRMCDLTQKGICKMKDKTITSGQKGKFELKLPVAPGLPGVPTHDHLRCQCYENSLRVIKGLEQDQVRPVSPVKYKTPKYVPDRLMNKVWSSFIHNEHTQLPLSTVVVRWQLRRYIPSYDMKELHNILSCYGAIAAIYQQSPNSAVVIFDNITSACRVMQTKQLGQLRNKIHCSWWHRYMTNKSFYTTRKGLAIKMNQFTQLLN